MSSGSGSTPTDSKRQHPRRGSRSEPIDYATMAGYRRVKSQRERSIPIMSSPSLAALGKSISSSSEEGNEMTQAISEQMPPKALKDFNSEPAHHIDSIATTGNPNSVWKPSEVSSSDTENIGAALSNSILGTGQDVRPEQEMKHDNEMNQPTDVHASSETHAPAVSGMEQPLQNSLLDGLFVEYGGALVIPFDVTSYPFWDDERELEDQLYWETWAANHVVTPGGASSEDPSHTTPPEDGKLQPPDNSSGSSSQRQ